MIARPCLTAGRLQDYKTYLSVGRLDEWMIEFTGKGQSGDRKSVSGK